MRWRRGNKKQKEPESFVWVTFSDLLSALFMVFMVVALWAISQKDEFAKKSADAIAAGKLCIENSKEAERTSGEKKLALSSTNEKIVAAFTELQNQGICPDVYVSVNEKRNGFHLYQKESQEKTSQWFKDGESTLSPLAQSCLNQIGKIWIEEINKSEVIYGSLEKLMVEGHANSKQFVGETEKNSFLRNLNLSQSRAFSAATYLIRTLDLPVRTPTVPMELRQLLVAQGKSSLEPILINNSEDFEKSKRLEFKIVLRGIPNAN